MTSSVSCEPQPRSPGRTKIRLPTTSPSRHPRRVTQDTEENARGPADLYGYQFDADQHAGRTDPGSMRAREPVGSWMAGAGRLRELQMPVGVCQRAQRPEGWCSAVLSVSHPGSVDDLGMAWWPAARRGRIF